LRGPNILIKEIRVVIYLNYIITYCNSNGITLVRYYLHTKHLTYLNIYNFPVRTKKPKQLNNTF